MSGLSVSDREDRYETETNPGSDWAYGNTGITVKSSAYSDTSSLCGRPKTGTQWDEYPGTARTTITNTSAKNEFIKQRAVPKSVEQKAREDLAREERRKLESEEVELEQSDSNDDSDGYAPY